MKSLRLLALQILVAVVAIAIWQIVPSLHSERLNPNIDFGTTPFEVNQHLRDWEAPVVDGKRMPRIAGRAPRSGSGSG